MEHIKSYHTGRSTLTVSTVTDARGHGAWHEDTLSFLALLFIGFRRLFYVLKHRRIYGNSQLTAVVGAPIKSPGGLTTSAPGQATRLATLRSGCRFEAALELPPPSFFLPVFARALSI